jgi:hypothetical protein
MESELNLDFLTALGLLLTAVGAFVTAKGVILAGDRAGEIGVSRWAGDDEESYEKLPLAVALSKASKVARIGLLLVVVGSLL